MATTQEKWQEIANRGLQDRFDPQTRAKFDEAVRRGLITIPNQQQTQQPAKATQDIIEQPQERSFLQGVGDIFTGDNRRTPEMERMGHLGQVGAISEIMEGQPLSKKAGFAALNLMTFNPNEVADIAKNMNPDISVIYNKDAEGNVYPILTNQKTGAVMMVNDPSLDISDLGRFAGVGTMFTPAGAASGAVKGLGKKIGVGTLASGATQTGIEGAQALSGGQIDPSEIALAGAGGALGEVIVPAAKAGFQATKQGLSKARDLISKFGSKTDNIVVEGIEQAARTPEEIIQIKAQEQAKGFQTDDMGNIIGSRQDQIDEALRAGDEQRLAKMIDADPQYFDDLQNLGITPEGVPTRASQSPQIVQTGEAFTKMIGSDTYEKAVNEHRQLQETANDILNRFGASDKASTDFELFEKGQQAIKDIKQNEKSLYNEINKNVSSNKESMNVSLNNSAEFINKLLSQSARGEKALGKLEKEILSFINEGASYSDLDNLRKQVGAAAFEGKDIYPDARQARLAKFYDLLTEDQEIAAGILGQAEAWNNAKKVSQQRKDLQDRSKALFGKNLDDKGVTARLAKSMNALANGNPKDFNKLVKSLPSGSKANDELRQTAVMTAVKDVLKGGSTKAEGLSIGNFANWYNKLNSSPAYKSALYKELPKEFRGQLDSLGRVATRLNNAMKSTPPTGMNLTSTAFLNKLKNQTRNFLGKWISGMTFGAVDTSPASKSELAKEAMDKAGAVLNNPNFLNLVKAVAQGKEEAVKVAEQKLMKTKAARELAESLEESQRKALVNQGFMRWFESQYGEEMDQAEESLKP